MLMIPLSFLVALAASVIFVREWLEEAKGTRRGWFMGFLCLLIFQELLIGVRFGYGVEWLRLIQPLSAVMIPPMAYLSFRRPALTSACAIHLLPFVMVCLTLAFFVDGLDFILALNNIFYAAALIRLGLQGSDGLPWADTHRANIVLRWLWIVFGVLMISGLTDGFIAYDFWLTQGENTGRIVGWASMLGIVIVGFGIAAYYLQKTASYTEQRLPEPVDDVVLTRLGALMADEKLFIDPDINLSRIARRLILPVRDVSKAVNLKTGGNVSQYINGLRIEEACRLLKDTDMQVTQIVFASGFNTKSNFNREFVRIKDMTPSEWRTLEY